MKRIIVSVLAVLILISVALVSYGRAEADCDQMSFVADVTVPDYSIMTPGQSFTKTWRVKNVGNCVWTQAYSLVFDSGNSMSGKSFYLSENVYPGDTVDIFIQLQAPYYSGTYEGDWRLKNSNGVEFGTTMGNPLWVKIQVGQPNVTIYNQPTATIQPVQPYRPAPETFPYYNQAPNGQYLYPVYPNPQPSNPCYPNCQNYPSNPINQNGQENNYPSHSGNSIQVLNVSVSDAAPGQVAVLTWVVQNNTGTVWNSDDMDIALTGGANILSDPSKVRWDLDSSVYNGGYLTFSVNVVKPWPGQNNSSMTFSIVVGKEIRYSFNINI